MKGLIAGFVAALTALGAAAQSPTAPSAARASKADGALECLVEPSMVVNVGSSVDGVLEQVLVDRGAQVHKGQVVRAAAVRRPRRRRSSCPKRASNSGAAS
jgi:multidrug efflux pump subunit AcrA (membrane-fusion protein)